MDLEVPYKLRTMRLDKLRPHPKQAELRMISTELRINRNSHDGKLHPVTFPTAFASAIIVCWKGFVYDPFLGSGTTMIACEQLGRKCYGIEIEPKYVQVCIDRWEAFTGKKAERVK